MRPALLCLVLCATLPGCATRGLRCEGPLQPINASPAAAGKNPPPVANPAPPEGPAVDHARGAGPSDKIAPGEVEP